MNDGIASKLRSYIGGNGDGILHDPRRLNSVMADLFPDDRLERRCLVVAVEYGAPETLRTAGASIQLVESQLAANLTDEYGLSDECATWAVSTIAELSTGRASARNTRAPIGSNREVVGGDAGDLKAPAAGRASTQRESQERSTERESDADDIPAGGSDGRLLLISVFWLMALVLVTVVQVVRSLP